jgi:hypothetical protein
MHNQSCKVGRIKKTWVVFILAILILGFCCFQFYSYFYYDPKYCIPKVAERLNTDPNWAAIAIFTKSKIEPGMTKDEIIQAIQEIGPIEVDSYKIPYSDDLFYEDYRVNLCLSHRYDIDIHCKYSEEMILKSFSIDMKP